MPFFVCQLAALKRTRGITASLRFLPFLFLGIQVMLTAALAASKAGEVPPQQPPAGTTQKETFYYRMKGSVRILLFWLGRDDVGGGHIAFFEMPASDGTTTVETTEVVFGSNPQRVPGKINRWGYGVEMALRSA